MHYYIISGELSGDLYGSKLMEQLKKNDADTRFTCWGGEYMRLQGGEMVRSLDQLAFLGFFEIFKNSFTIFQNLLFAKRNIKTLRPDILILIDYPGFNFKIAKYAKKIGIPVFWFVAPQLWAWKANRIRLLRKYVDKLFVVLPFELEYFVQRNIKTYYFGHPLLDIIEPKILSSALLGKPIIALLPGSREQEVRTMLPIMLSLINRMSSYRFVIICVQSVKRSLYQDLIKDYNVELKFTKDILSNVSAAVVTSGTATLEMSILKIPQVVCYKVNFLTYLLARIFIKIKYVSLVNILMNEKVVPELLQHNFNIENMELELKRVLQPKYRNRIIEKYNFILKKLGGPGCFEKISKTIYSDLKAGINNAANK